MQILYFCTQCLTERQTRGGRVRHKIENCVATHFQKRQEDVVAEVQEIKGEKMGRCPIMLKSQVAFYILWHMVK